MSDTNDGMVVDAKVYGKYHAGLKHSLVNINQVFNFGTDMITNSKIKEVWAVLALGMHPTGSNIGPDAIAITGVKAEFKIAKPTGKSKDGASWSTKFSVKNPGIILDKEWYLVMQDSTSYMDTNYVSRFGYYMYNAIKIDDTQAFFKMLEKKYNDKLQTKQVNQEISLIDYNLNTDNHTNATIVSWTINDLTTNNVKHTYVTPNVKNLEYANNIFKDVFYYAGKLSETIHLDLLADPLKYWELEAAIMLNRQIEVKNNGIDLSQTFEHNGNKFILKSEVKLAHNGDVDKKSEPQFSYEIKKDDISYLSSIHEIIIGQKDDKTMSLINVAIMHPAWFYYELLLPSKNEWNLRNNTAINKASTGRNMVYRKSFHMLRDLVMEFNLNSIDTKQYYTNKIKNDALMSKPFGTITLDLESMAQEASLLEYKKTETKKLHKKLKKIKEQEKAQREREKPSIF